jgi:hypothetical protein
MKLTKSLLIIIRLEVVMVTKSWYVEKPDIVWYLNKTVRPSREIVSYVNKTVRPSVICLICQS